MSNFLLISDKWAKILLAKDLLHHFHTIIYHNMDLKEWDPIKILENFCF